MTNSETKTKSFTVRYSLLGIVSNTVNRLNRRAARLGVEPIEMTVSEPRAARSSTSS